VLPAGKAIEESVVLAYEIFNRVFRMVTEMVPFRLLNYSTAVGDRQKLTTLLHQ